MVQDFVDSRHCKGLLILAVLCCCLLSVTIANAQIEDALWSMYHEPELPTPTVNIVHQPGLVQLWLQALQEDDLDLKRRAAGTITAAVQRGVPELELAVPVLIEMLRDPQQTRIMQLTIARTLVALDAKEAADLLFEQLSGDDLEMAEIVEPALAAWSYRGAVDMWAKRLDGDAAFRRSQVLAVQGLSALKVEQSVPRFRELAADRRESTSIRVAAADAVGKLTTSGMLDTARALTQDQSPEGFVDRLVAVKMLVGHRGKEAEVLLIALALDSMPPVQAIALTRLNEIDPALVMPLVDPLIESSDANVRSLVARALISVAKRPTLEKVAKLGPLLDDPNPTLRALVRDAMVQLAELDGFRASVLAQSRDALDNDTWRGQEQAMRVLVALQEKPTVDRLLELLNHQRPEVHVTAAWGLCELAVPEALDRILEIFQRRTEARLTMTTQLEGVDEQLAHLAQAIGKMKHLEADETLRKYIPKDTTLAVESRAAAIWALGKLHQDKPDEVLAGQLEERLLDTESLEPEDPLVRRFCAIAIGDMKAANSSRALERTVQHDTLREGTGISAAWALCRINDAPMPKVPPVRFQDSSWFLIPAAE